MINLGARCTLDASKIQRHATELTAAAYALFGQRVCDRAQASMIDAKGPAKPGEPPHSHFGTLKKSIQYSVETGGSPTCCRVIAGPVANSHFGGDVPRRLETGEVGDAAAARQVPANQGRSSRMTRKQKLKWVKTGVAIGARVALFGASGVASGGASIAIFTLWYLATRERSRPATSAPKKPRAFPYMAPAFHEELRQLESAFKR